MATQESVLSLSVYYDLAEHKTDLLPRQKQTGASLSLTARQSHFHLLHSGPLRPTDPLSQPTHGQAAPGSLKMAVEHLER